MGLTYSSVHSDEARVPAILFLSRQKPHGYWLVGNGGLRGSLVLPRGVVRYVKFDSSRRALYLKFTLK